MEPEKCRCRCALGRSCRSRTDPFWQRTWEKADEGDQIRDVQPKLLPRANWFSSSIPGEQFSIGFCLYGSWLRTRYSDSSKSHSFGGRPRLGIGFNSVGTRPARFSSLRSNTSIWAFTERISSAAHFCRASCTAGSKRSRIAFRSDTFVLSKGCPR